MILNFPLFCNNLYPYLKAHPEVKRRKVIELHKRISKFSYISHLNNLPKDLLNEVFKCLEMNELYVIKRVSRKFNSLMNEKPNPLVFEGDWAKLEKFGENLFNPAKLYKIELTNSVSLDCLNKNYVKCHFFPGKFIWSYLYPCHSVLILCDNSKHKFVSACLFDGVHDGNTICYVNGKLDNNFLRHNHDIFLVNLRVYDLKVLIR